MTHRPVRSAKPMRVIRLLLGPFRQRLYLGSALAALTVLAGMGLLGLSGWFIAATAIAGLQVGSALVFDVFMPSAGIRLLALGRTASRYGERLLTHDATLATLAALRERVFRSVAAGRQRLRQPARALSRLTSELDALESLYLRLLVPACAALGAAVLVAFILGLIAPWFGLLMGLWLLLAGWGVAWMLARAARVPALRRAMVTERLRSHAIDLVSGQTELLMGQRLGAQCQALSRADLRLACADRRLNRLDVQAGAAYGIASSITLALALLGAGALSDQGLLGTATAALVLLLAMAAMEPFAALRRGALEAGRVWLATRRLSVHLAAGPDALATAPPTQGALHMLQVSARYSCSHVDVIHGVSLTLGSTERVALIGPSGSGKSTLMALATGVMPALRGTVQAQPHAWMGQRIDLFQDSLRDNLRMAAPQASDAQLWAALEVAGLATDVRAMSDGLDTHLGDGGLGLSGGQARRLALARLLLRPQRLWLLDEPTEGLDAATAADVLKKLDALGIGRAWLMATHLRREAALADRLLMLRAGRIDAEWRRGSAGFNAALACLKPD